MMPKRMNLIWAAVAIIIAVVLYMNWSATQEPATTSTPPAQEQTSPAQEQAPPAQEQTPPAQQQ